MAAVVQKNGLEGQPQVSDLSDSLDKIGIANLNFRVLNRPEVEQFYKDAGFPEWGMASETNAGGIFLGFIQDGKVAAAVRIHQNIDDFLPVKEQFHDLKLEAGDIQIGRLAVAPEFRSTRVILRMFEAFETFTSDNPHRIIATPRGREDGGLSFLHYKLFGFDDTNQKYLYPAGVELHLMIHPASQKAKQP